MNDDLETPLRVLNEVAAGLNRLNLEARGQLDSALELIARGVKEAFPGFSCRIVRGAPGGVSLDGHTICLPLRWRGNGEGWLWVETNGQPLSRSQGLVLESFGQQACSALNQAHQLHEVGLGLARKERELTRLGRAGLLISSRRSLEETLKSILQMALEVTGARYGILRLLDRRRQTLVTAAVVGKGMVRPLVEELELAASSITGWVATNLQSICITDLDEQPWKGLYYPLDHELNMRSELAVPMLGAGGSLEGVLNLESPHVGQFQDEDRILLQALANQAVIAIQQVRLLDVLQQLAELSLFETCQHVLERLVGLARELLGADQVWLLVEEDGKTICRAFSGELVSESWALVESARVVVHGTTHRVEIPVMQPGGVRGLLGLASRTTGASEWETKVLTCLAHHAGLALLSEEREARLRATQEQRALAETFAALGDVTANLMHQLNNKVGVIPVRIEGISERCQASLAADPYLERNLREVDRNAREALKVVRESFQLLDPRSVGPTRIEECVRLSATELKIHVQMEGLEVLPPVVGGQPGVRLIFWNLFDNAKRILRKAGLPEEVKVTGQVSEQSVLVVVSDRGPGVDPKRRENIFDMAVQAERGGLGFGLWWVRCLMIRLGGTVELIRSTNGRGATFQLTFPKAV